MSHEIGDKLPIELLLSDGNETMYPQAVVWDDEGNLLSTLDLSHSVNGLYVPAAGYLMPDEKFLSVVYIVYTDAIHTIESKYVRDLDIFSLSGLSVIEEKIDIIDTNIDTIIAKLPVGIISDLALTDTIDDVAFSRILEYVMSMFNGKFDESTPGTGKRTFYRRNNVTVLSVIEVDTSGRRRTI